MWMHKYEAWNEPNKPHCFHCFNSYCFNCFFPPCLSSHPALVARPRDRLGAALMEHGEAAPR